MKKGRERLSKIAIIEDFYFDQIFWKFEERISQFIFDLNKARDKEDVLVKHRNEASNRMIFLQGNSIYMSALRARRKIYEADQSFSEFEALIEACKLEKVELKNAVEFLSEYEALLECGHKMGEIYFITPGRKEFKEVESASNNDGNLIKLLQALLGTNFKPEKNQNNTPLVTSTPYFLKNKIVEIVDALEPYFEDKIEELRDIIENWKIAKSKLLFRGPAYKLGDVFLKLHDADIIMGGKSDLISWIHGNFLYIKKSKAKEFSIHYVRQLINTKKWKFKNLILDVRPGKQIVIM